MRLVLFRCAVWLGVFVFLAYCFWLMLFAVANLAHAVSEAIG